MDDVHEKNHRANVARIEQLIEYAEAKPYNGPESSAYWNGFAEGLRRALRVVKGEG